MKMNQIMDTIKMLSMSQGFYGRLYRQIMELDAEDYDRVAEELESQNFSDAVDMVLYFET